MRRQFLRFDHRSPRQSHTDHGCIASAVDEEFTHILLPSTGFILVRLLDSSDNMAAIAITISIVVELDMKTIVDSPAPVSRNWF
jgi:hypothetical protein